MTNYQCFAIFSSAANLTPEERGEICEERVFYDASDKISLSLEYGYGENQQPDKQSEYGSDTDRPNSVAGTRSESRNGLKKNEKNSTTASDPNKPTKSNDDEKSNNALDVGRRYLLCPAGISVHHLKKFIATKFSLSKRHKVRMIDSLSDRNGRYNRDYQIHRCYVLIPTRSTSCT